MPDTLTLGQRIREARLSRGMSLGQLASAVGCPAASVRTWERDEAAPNADAIASIADLLELDQSELEELAQGNGGAEPTVDEDLAGPEPGGGDEATDLETAAGSIDEVAESFVDPLTSQTEAEMSDRPTEAVAVPATPVTEELEVPHPRRPIATFFTGLYDPEKRWLYWIRSALTVIAMVVLLMVLIWAAGELFEALGEVWDSLGREP